MLTTKKVPVYFSQLIFIIYYITYLLTSTFIGLLLCSSVRHNLSLLTCFKKGERSPNGRGFYWSVSPQFVVSKLMLPFRTLDFCTFTITSTTSAAAVRLSY